MSNREMPTPSNGVGSQVVEEVAEKIKEVNLSPKIAGTESAPVSNLVQQKEEVVKPSSIEVIALRDGFVYNRRIKEGDKFFLKSEDMLGSWTLCVDPKMEEKRQLMLSKKKVKKRAK